MEDPKRKTPHALALSVKSAPSADSTRLRASREARLATRLYPLLPTPRPQLKFRRFLACARNKLWWMTPEWGTALGDLPPETQFLLLELEEPGAYGLVLPLIDGDFRATLRPNK